MAGNLENKSQKELQKEVNEIVRRMKDPKDPISYENPREPDGSYGSGHSIKKMRKKESKDATG